MKSRRFGIVSACALIIGALALMVFRWSAAGEAVYPVERLVRLIGRTVGSRFSGLLEGASLGGEVSRLRREVAELSLLRGDIERLTAENRRLRSMLDYRSNQGGTWLAAEVLSFGGGATVAHRSIRVSKGTLDGVKEGAVVVVPDGLVGRVSSVSPHSAEVRLVTDPSVRVSCAVETGIPGGVHGILSGAGSDGLLLRHVDPDAELKPQARVVTSGFGGVFPGGIGIGTLLLVTNGVRGAEIEVKPSVDYSTLEDVFIRRGQ